MSDVRTSQTDSELQFFQADLVIKIYKARLN